jgi:hypothetical protein
MPVPTKHNLARSAHKPEQKAEKATRQLGGLFLQGRIVLTEVKPSKLSGEILWAVEGGVKIFLVNKYL